MWSAVLFYFIFSEFLASEGNDNFWAFVDRVAQLNPDAVADGMLKLKYRMNICSK